MMRSLVPLERGPLRPPCGDLRALGEPGRCLGTEKMRSAMQLPLWGKMARGRGLSGGPGHRPEELGRNAG